LINDAVLYLIAALVASPTAVAILCFGAKLIHLKREYTELFIPILGIIVFISVFQVGLMGLGLIKFNSIISAAAVSIAVYIICRKFGRKSSAVRRHWIFIGITFLITLATFMVVYFANNIKDSLNMLDLFFGSFLSFIFMLFNMLFYKITKEISFAIRKKKKN